MEPPQNLSADAKAFWRRHWPRLFEAGHVHEADAETFTLLCRTWAELQAVDTSEEKVGVLKFVALSKQYERLAKQFHLLPAERQRRNVSLSGKKKANEFGI